MVFRRSQRNPIKTDKHEVRWSNLQQDASTVKTVPLVTTVEVGNKNTGIEVAVGSHVRWIYLEFHVSPEVVTVPIVYEWQIIVSRGQSFGAPNTYYQDQRSFIIKRGMEMLVKDLSNVYKRIIVVKIPRAYQRMKMGSKIDLQYIASSTNAVNSCGFAIYKEQY